jgi:hypothetical protein
MATNQVQNMYNQIKAAGSAKAFASQAQPAKIQPVTRTIQRQAQSVDSFDSLVRSVKW